jgi:uncharacterized delta-60 repeat protein
MPELSRKLEALILDILPTFILNENQSIYSLNWDFIVVPIWCFKKIGFILISYFCFKFCTMKILFTAILSILTYSIFAQTAGSLDPSFGTAGKVQLDLGGIDSKAYAVSIQTDGYILVSGYSTSAIYGKDFTIVRLDADGNLDLNFGTNGVVSFDLQAGSDDIIYSSIIQLDGKIVVAGVSDDGVEKKAALARLNEDGSFDDSFGTDGKVVTDWVAGQQDIIRVLKYHAATGNLVVGGTSEVSSTSAQPIVARYLSTGELDTNFNTTGIKSMAIIAGDELRTFVVEDLEVKANGKISVAGWKRYITGVISYEWWAGRLLSTGDMDNTFSTDGVVNFDESGSNLAYAMELKSNDDLVLFGTKSFNGLNTMRLLGITSIGNIPGSSTSFNIGADQDIAYTSATDMNGNYVFAGSSGTPTSNSFAIVRATSSGVADVNFGTSGIVITNFTPGTANECHEIAVQTDNKIVAVGFGGSQFAIARYLGEDEAQLNTFALVAPSNGAASQSFASITFDWTDAFAAAGYELELDVDVNFTTSPVTYTSVSSTKTITNLLPGTTYYWRVRANANSIVGDWIGVRNFTTSSLNAFNLATPANNTTNVAVASVILDWTTLTGASSYEVQFDTDMAFSSPTQFNPSTSSQTVTSLSYSTTYYWRVRATNGTLFGDWTTTWNFTTQANPISVGEISAQPILEVYPQPATDNVQVKIDSRLLNSNYSIVDELGRVVDSGRFISLNTTIAVDELPAGIYFIQVPEMQSARIIVQ